jgi:simple sugar transport system permease protein
LFGTAIHLGVLVAFALVPAVWWLLWRSTLGFEIRTVGANPDAARYAGMRPAVITILTLSLCGMLAGLAGAGQILGISHFMNASYGTSIGFDSIAVALLGRAHPVGIMLAALLFGALRAGSGLMQIQAGIPVEIVDVIQATILLFLAARLITFRLPWRRVAVAEELPEELQTVSRTYGSGT